MNPQDLNKDLGLEAPQMQSTLDNSFNQAARGATQKIESTIIAQAGNRKIVDRLGDEEYTLLAFTSLPSGGLFYPSDMEILIKPATTKEIEKYSMMSIENAQSILNEIIGLISSCIKVKYTNQGRLGSPTDILDCDKIAILLAIREISFVEEDKITFDYMNPETGQNIKAELSRNACHFDKPDGDVQEKYYSRDRKAYYFDTKYGEFELAPPTLKTSLAFIDYAKNKYNKQNKSINSAFVAYGIWLTAFRNVNNLKFHELERFEKEFEKYSEKQFQILKKCVDTINRYGITGINAADMNGAEVRIPFEGFSKFIPDLFALSGSIDDFIRN